MYSRIRLTTPGHVDERRRVGQNESGLIEERMACSSQFHATGGTLEQLHTQFVFELANMAAEGRLGEVKLPRRPGKAP
jgi:hypothetical protein